MRNTTMAPALFVKLLPYIPRSMLHIQHVTFKYPRRDTSGFLFQKSQLWWWSLCYDHVCYNLVVQYFGSLKRFGRENIQLSFSLKLSIIIKDIIHDILNWRQKTWSSSKEYNPSSWEIKASTAEHGQKHFRSMSLTTKSSVLGTPAIDLLTSIIVNFFPDIAGGTSWNKYPT